MVDRSVPMRVEESNQCESPISIARERSSYSKRFVKLLQDFIILKNSIFWVWTQKCHRLIPIKVKTDFSPNSIKQSFDCNRHLEENSLEGAIPSYPSTFAMKSKVYFVIFDCHALTNIIFYSVTFCRNLLGKDFFIISFVPCVVSCSH